MEESLKDGKTGCDDVVEMGVNALYQVGLEPNVKLVKYEDK